MEQEDNNEQGNEGNEPSEHAEEQINIDKKDEDITKEREADESESEDEMGDQMENVILYIPTGKSTEIISKDQHEKLLKLDMYGFDLPDKSNEPDIYQAYLSNKAMVSQKIEKQRARWAKLLKTRKSALSEKDTKNSTLKQLFRKGIPPEYRGEVYYHICGAAEAKEQKGDGYYKNLLMKKLSLNSENDLQDYLSTITDENQRKNMNEKLKKSYFSEKELSYLSTVNKDLGRTFPEHFLFRTCNEDPQQNIHAKKMLASLKNVLFGWCLMHPQIGYCQSINFLAGILLLLTNDEEKTFWILNTIGDKYLPQDFYDDTLEGLKCEIYALEYVCKEKKPKIYEKLQQNNICFPMFATSWFLCLYVSVFPPETAMRVLDTFFFEGYKVLFRTGLAILSLIGNELLRVKNSAVDGGMGAIFTLLQNFPKCAFDSRKILKTSFGIRNFSRKSILKYRKIYRETEGQGK